MSEAYLGWDALIQRLKEETKTNGQEIAKIIRKNYPIVPGYEKLLLTDEIYQLQAALDFCERYLKACADEKLEGNKYQAAEALAEIRKLKGEK